MGRARGERTAPGPEAADAFEFPLTVLTPTKARLFTAITLALSLLAALAAMETAVRLHREKLLVFENVRGEALRVLVSFPAEHDPLLGYVPRPGTYPHNIWDKRVTISVDRLRMNGRERPESDLPPILAVGDSYTFGDALGDDETWPAHLEGLVRRPVLNGGVFGYGVDQMVLRAEQLLESFRPSLLIISMIADDLARNEMSYRYAWKPYFDIVDDRLVLKNVPVPDDPPPAKLRRLRSVLSYSHLADAIFHRLAPTWWLLEGEQRVHDRGTEVAALLMERLARYCAERGVPVLVVTQCDRSVNARALQPVLARARAAGMRVLDLAAALARRLREDPTLIDQFYFGPFSGHMTAAGNRWVAERIAAEIRRLEGS